MLLVLSLPEDRSSAASSFCELSMLKCQQPLEQRSQPAIDHMAYIYNAMLANRRKLCTTVRMLGRRMSRSRLLN